MRRGTTDALVGLGFVAGEAQVIASIDADIANLVVTDVGGTEHEGRLVAADERLGLGLLAVPGPCPRLRTPSQASRHRSRRKSMPPRATRDQGP